MDRAELELLARSLSHALDTAAGDALDAALEKLGWHDAVAVDRPAAVSLLFDLQGRANSASSGLDHLVVAALGLQAAPSSGVLWPALGSTRPPGDVDNARVTVHGLARGACETLLVVAQSGDHHVAGVVPAAELDRRTVHGLDPRVGLVEITGEATPAALERVEWPAAVAVAQLALGHEILGASRQMLELAREHALTRVQFGRPIAAFQAVRHRLAETLVAIEMAEAMLDAAWLDETPPTAAMAKAVAGRAGRTAARHCQQVLAGIGFTAEHPLHRYVRRVLVLDQLFGDARSLTEGLGRDILRSRRLPPLLPL